MAIAAAEQFHNDTGFPIPQITHVGHSLGGAHVEIQAYRFGHEGVTFNGYGAVGMRGVRQGDGDVTNYAKAADVVSAANAHYGKVILLAEQDDIAPMKKIGYNNKSNTAAPYAFGVAAISMGTHLSSHFVGKDSILSDRNYDRARRLADENKFMIQDYRGDVETSKNAIAAAKFATSNPIEKIEILRNRLEKYDREQERIKEIINSVPPPKSLFDSRMLHLMQNDGTRPDAGKEAYADAGKPDISKPLAKNASAEEFREYGFAALLADDDDKRYAALDSLLDSDVGRGLRQNADKVYAAQEREQEMARLAEEQARQTNGKAGEKCRTAGGAGTAGIGFFVKPFGWFCRKNQAGSGRSGAVGLGAVGREIHGAAGNDGALAVGNRPRSGRQAAEIGKGFEKAGLGVGRSLCADRIAVFRYCNLSDPIRQNGNEACRMDCRH